MRVAASVVGVEIGMASGWVGVDEYMSASDKMRIIVRFTPNTDRIADMAALCICADAGSGRLIQSPRRRLRDAPTIDASLHQLGAGLIGDEGD
jgi:hypothetical protein